MRVAQKLVGRLGFTLLLAAALGILIWFAWAGIGTRDQVRLASHRAVRVAELRGLIAYLDEWQTMSVQMAVTSGDQRWVARFNEAGPRLDAAIAEAVALATPEVSAALERTLDEANQGLRLMERAAIARTAAGDLQDAQALIGGPEFAYLKAVYASGIEAFGDDLTTFAAARSRQLDDRAWLEAGGLALGALCLVAAAVSVRGHRRLKQALAHTEAIACTDALTGLANRRRFYNVLRAALSETERGGDPVALLLLDLDRFKVVNDVHGHIAGDHLLQLVATRLRIAARAGDLVARLGGDEFALIARLGQAPDRNRLEAAAAHMAQRIIAAMDQPLELPSGLLLQVTASIGVVLAQPTDASEPLLHQADVALYRAKVNGRGRYQVYAPELDADTSARACLEDELRQAVAGDCIVPHFQPLVSMQTGAIIGFEMLARWPHPTRGMVSPAEFIPVAEDIGLIGTMTDRLLRRACLAAASWPPGITLACNVSPLQLHDRSLASTIKAALDSAGLSPDRLELEITESALVGDPKVARAVLEELKVLGIRLALDDFGTGYSSLRHLQLLPFDKLKIDASFVSRMVGNPESRKIVGAVVAMCQSLGLTTVGEGIEDAATATLLRSLGCDIGQGWLFGRPAPADATADLLRCGTQHVRGRLEVVRA